MKNILIVEYIKSKGYSILDIIRMMELVSKKNINYIQIII